MDMEKIYRKIAKAHGVTVDEVKAEMAHALSYAWNNEEKTESEAFVQSQISPHGSTPSAEDFIRHVAKSIKK